MKIIVDNGGTKSDWAIIDTNQKFSGPGINVFDSEETIVSQIRHLLSEEILTSNEVSIDFYTAGLTESVEIKIIKIFHEYFNNIRVSVFSDMLCASRALFQFDKGVVCILGTGSNCAYFDGSKNHQISPSLGYLFGDEGSGYDLGKRFLIKYFNNELLGDLNIALEEETKMNKDQLLSSIYSSKNKKFDIARFSFFLKKHESNHQIRKIISDSILNFLSCYVFRYIDVKSDCNNAEVGFVGSIAFNFSDIIDEIMLKHRVKYRIIKKPIDDLINYYKT